MQNILQIHLDQYESFFDTLASEITPIFGYGDTKGPGLDTTEKKITATQSSHGQPHTTSYTPHRESDIIPNILHGDTYPTTFAPPRSPEPPRPTQHSHPTVVVEDRAYDGGTYDAGDDDDEIELCDTVKKVIYPTSATSETGVDLFIFNSDDHKQGVHVSICQNAGNPCDDFVVLRNNYRSECKQQSIYRELLSLSPQGRPIKQRFEFPASCTCILRRVRQSN